MFRKDSLIITISNTLLHSFIMHKPAINYTDHILRHMHWDIPDDDLWKDQRSFHAH